MVCFLQLTLLFVYYASKCSVSAYAAYMCQALYEADCVLDC
jgi:hypothetical protein